MGKALTMLAMAKINLTLEIVGLRDDGYHLIRSVMQSISLHDKVVVKPCRPETGVRLTLCGDYAKGLPADKSNTAKKAAHLFFESSGISGGAVIKIYKNIPCKAGLGGGSADAAAVLHGLNRLYGSPYKQEDIAALGAKIGADVPFCTAGGTCLAEGIGEHLTFLPPPPDCFIVVVKGEKGASTPEVYKLFDDMSQDISPVSYSDTLLTALLRKDFHGMASGLYNALEPAALALCPSIESIKTLLLESGAAGVLVSGSGSSVFGIFSTLAPAQNACKTAQNQGLFAACCHPVPHGVTTAV